MPDGSAQRLGCRLDLGDPALGLNDVWDVAQEDREVFVGPAARSRMMDAHECLARMVGERRRIYGVTTGYGPLASHYVLPEHAEELQRNLIYHLASGVGRPLSRSQTRALMATRISSLSCGFSGIGSHVIDLLVACLNDDITPLVPEMGTVGASGDLTPLAHVALVLIGEGEAVVGGRQLPGSQALRSKGLQPVTLGHKEGLALVNGTAAMTGISCLNGVGARRAASLGLRLGVLYAELMRAPNEAYDPRLGSARPHRGQIAAHRALARLARGSRRLAPTAPPPVLQTAEQAPNGVIRDQPIPQAPYTARCLPQIFGAIIDLLDFHDRTVETELNSATDNPLIFAEDEAILHGGNFYGQHVAFAADTLQLATAKIALHAERCLARLCDPLTNGGLPAFLQSGPIGRNSGFMGAQVTASALVAEIRSKAGFASIQSIPTNNNNQDVVTMGTIASRKTAELLELTWLVLAIHAMALAQACEMEGGLRDANSTFSAESRNLCEWVRQRVAFLDRDRPLSDDIQTLAAALARENWAIE